MYLDISVPVPAEKGKITVKTINYYFSLYIRSNLQELSQ